MWDGINTDDCIDWPLSKQHYGHGQKMVKGKLWKAHRWEWTQVNGPIPEGMQINHKCDNPSCVNIDHLYMGTQKDNVQDQIKAGTKATPWVAKTHCPAGHLYSETEVTRPNGQRYCRLCHRKSKRESARRMRNA